MPLFGLERKTMEETFPRIVIAGTGSGSGKTVFTAGLLDLLRTRGLTVQPFKAGQDFIDPAYHTMAARRPCRNLDTMMLSGDGVRELFARAATGADLSVVEGVMGLYDGAGTLNGRGSTADLAKELDAPVILLVNGRGMGRSAAAVVFGFAEFDPGLRLYGVMLNGLGSESHYRLLKRAIEEEVGIDVLGWLPQDAGIVVPERRMGLAMPGESKGGGLITASARLIAKHVDVSALLKVARESPPLPSFRASIFADPAQGVRARIAIAMDEAFGFYDRYNLDVMEHLGVELVSFSPLRDSSLPPGVGGVYIGGGMPDEYAPRLADNAALRAELRAAADAGMPMLAEGAGLVYLAERFVDGAGSVHGMAGVFPGTVRLEESRQALGYWEGRLERAALPGTKGAVMRGRMFHYFSYDSGGNDDLFSMRLEKGESTVRDGLARKSAFASFLTVHFGSNPSLPERFLDRAEKYKGGK